MDSDVDYVRDLNNYLQTSKQRSVFSWQFKREGPGHETAHTALALLDDKVIGVGVAGKKKDAKVLAAREALVALSILKTDK